MKDWTAGYVADVGYTYGYYSELNPARVPLALLSAGLASPRIETACELGFGQGLSVNLHAATSLSHWMGTDFNPRTIKKLTHTVWAYERSDVIDWLELLGSSRAVIQRVDDSL